MKFVVSAVPAVAGVVVAVVQGCMAVNGFYDTSDHSNSCISFGTLRICKVSPSPFPWFLDKVYCCLDQQLRMYRPHSREDVGFDDRAIVR